MTRNEESGLTIIEILITLVLITVLFAPIFYLIQQGTMRTYRGGDETLATVYAADILELIRGGPYEVFYKGGQNEDKNLGLKEVFGRSNFFAEYNPDTYAAGRDQAGGKVRFTIRVDVGPAGDIPASKLKKARVRVAWQDRQTKKPKEIKMVTFYSPSTL